MCHVNAEDALATRHRGKSDQVYAVNRKPNRVAVLGIPEDRDRGLCGGRFRGFRDRDRRAGAGRAYPEITRPLVAVAILEIARLAIVALPALAWGAVRKHLLAPHGVFLSSQTVSLSSSAQCISRMRSDISLVRPL